MIALRYFCGFSLQIFPYAFFCLYPFRDRFRLSTKKTMLMALSIFIVMVIPFSLIAQFNIGGDYKELISNAIFYIALLLFGMLYCFIIQAKTVEKLFVFFVVMSYGFFVTSTVTFLHRTFRFPSDHFMFPPLALILTLIINLLLAKPFLMLMERIRTMINADLESRIWKILCSLPALFILIASIAQFSSIINLSTNMVVHAMFVLFYHPGKNSRKTVCIFCCNELRILCYKHRYLFAPYFPVSIRLFYVSALCTGSHTYHKSGSCETISHADGANPYYDQCRSGITDLEDSLLPPCFVYSDCQHCTVLKHNKSFQ